MWESIIILPSLAATAMVMLDKSLYANLLYFVGNVLLLLHNYNKGDMVQVILFGVYEIFAIVGILLYMRKNGYLNFRKMGLKNGQS